MPILATIAIFGAVGHWNSFQDSLILNANTPELYTLQHRLYIYLTGIVAAYIFVFTMLYAFALLARYENNLLNTLRNGFNISMRYFLRSALLVIIVEIELTAMLWSPKTMSLILICGPAFVMLTVCSVAINIFRDIESKNPESVERDESSEQSGTTEQ